MKTPLVTTEFVSCNTCGSPDADELVRAHDVEFQTCCNEFTFVKCRACGHVYLRDRPVEAELGVIYPREYYSYETFLGPLASRARALSQRQKADFVSRLLGEGPARILDVGCGTGELLRVLKDRGNPAWTLVGLDISDHALTELKRAGVEGLAGRFETAGLPAESFDLIVMNQTLEHLADPKASLIKAHGVLKRGGSLLVETPSLDAWDARLFPAEMWAGWHCPRHWNLYTPESLSTLALLCGFSRIDVSALPSPYFWLRSAKQVMSRWWLTAPLSGWFDERSIPLLAGAVLLDKLQTLVRGRTSNQRMVARKD